jgi:peptidoglycan/LPS O-acetylase OafA/YrhL
MDQSLRRYDIDWLRVIAIGLLLIYHIAIVFQPWGVFIGFIQSSDSLDSIWTPMSMLNVWRIPLLFYVSGMGLGFAIRKRNWKQLLGERSRRILIPFLFGMLFIAPIHMFIWQKYYSQDLAYSLNPVHLWFLANIFLYVLILSPLFFFLKRNENARVGIWIKRIFSNPLGLLIITILTILEVSLLNPDTFALYAMTWHGFFLGLLVFLFGFIFIYCGKAFWNMILKWRWPFLVSAVALYILRLLEFELQSPYYLMAIESNLWVFTVLGFGYKYLNHSGKALSYLSQAAYPVYIIHMAFLYLGSYIILPLEISVWMKFILIIVFTMAGCFASYELIIRRFSLTRLVFGLKKI